MNPAIAIIAAVARNGLIGRDNALPWRLPSDLKTFKRLTMGKPIIMGRATFHSIGRPLPGRANIVISSDAGIRDTLGKGGVIPAADLADAVRQADTIARATGAEEIMIIGGARVYGQALALADRIYLTRVEAEPEGDAFFPPLAPGDWREVSATPIERTPGDDHACTLIVLERSYVATR